MIVVCMVMVMYFMMVMDGDMHMDGAWGLSGCGVWEKRTGVFVDHEFGIVFQDGSCNGDLGLGLSLSRRRISNWILGSGSFGYGRRYSKSLGNRTSSGHHPSTF